MKNSGTSKIVTPGNLIVHTWLHRVH